MVNISVKSGKYVKTEALLDNGILLDMRLLLLKQK